MTTDLELLSTPQRQSRWAIVFLALRALRQIGVGQLVILVIFLGRLPPLALVVLVPFAAATFLAIGIVGWWRFTFVVQDHELRVTKGVVSEDRLSVPLDRVQSVSLEQGFIHRLIGLVGVSLDTAGTSEAEFTIDTVDTRIAEALQRVTAERRTAVASVDPAARAALPPPEVTLIQRDLNRLLLAGVARPAFSGLAVIAPLLAVAEDLAGVVPVDLPEVEGDEIALTALLWIVPLVLGIGIVAGLVLNLVQIVLTQWNLSLTYRDGGFRRSAGLISRTSRSTNVARVQSVSWRRNPVEARLGIRRLRLPTLGEGELAIPGSDDDELASLRRLVLEPDPALDSPSRRISPAEVFRATRNAAVVAVVAAGLLWFAVGWWALLTLGLIPVAWLAARRRVARARWELRPTGMVRRDQLVTERSTEISLRKVNGVTLRQGWFERSRGLATVVVRTAAGSISIGMIDVDEAAAVRDAVLATVERDRRPWM